MIESDRVTKSKTVILSPREVLAIQVCLDRLIRLEPHPIPDYAKTAFALATAASEVLTAAFLPKDGMKAPYFSGHGENS